MEIIRFDNFSFSYSTQSGKSLHDISFSVNDGEFVTICGKSGSGKSTLIRQLKPIISPHGKKSGCVFFEGKDILSLTQREQAEKIGFVLQNPDNQIVTDKVWHELAFGLESLSYKSSEIRSKVAEMASFFGIHEWFHNSVTELSGGQKQLLNLASVMVMQPSLLILDEPTSQLDPIAAREFLEAVSRINQELGTTVIITEHRLEEVFPMSDKVIALDGGRIIADAAPCEVGHLLKDNDIFLSFPTPMRICAAVSEEEEYPITVRDGRRWLGGKSEKRMLDVSDKPMKSHETVLEIKDVWFRYERGESDVIKGLSAAIKKGELFAIVGGNGTGKTTALSLICGTERPQRGKIVVANGEKIIMLPQNPQSLFVKKTVELDLYDMLNECKLKKDEAQDRVRKIADICEISGLLDRHPYDLSGGEQQRAALAKVLLQSPDILLLDEPTKGLDAHFKRKLAEILKDLCDSGIAVIVVSHDIEFCAEYSNRCAMFFDGSIISVSPPREFFSGKSFYTTAANRMARDVFPNAVLAKDIIAALGAEVSTETKKRETFDDYPPVKESLPKTEKKNRTAVNYVFGVLFALVFAAAELYLIKFRDGNSPLLQLITICLLWLSLYNLLPKKEISMSESREKRRRLSGRSVAACLGSLVAIPLTVFIGYYYLGDRKYYFISLLIILEAMLPFALVFEHRKPMARELVVISVLCAIAVAGRAAFFMLPQFKPILAVIIISGVCFGGETGFLVGAISGFVSNFYFGQGPWTPWQMFAFGIVGLFAGVLFKTGLIRKTNGSLCIYGAISALVIFGGIMNPTYVLLQSQTPTLEMILSSYALGLPFDIIHAASTVFFLRFAAAAMIEKLDRIKIKYGFME